MTKDIPAGSGQLDPETAAKLALLIQQSAAAVHWGRAKVGDRLKDYALDEVQRVLVLMGEVVTGASQ